MRQAPDPRLPRRRPRAPRAGALGNNNPSSLYTGVLSGVQRRWEYNEDYCYWHTLSNFRWMAMGMRTTRNQQVCGSRRGARKGTNGVGTHGVTANLMLFDRYFFVLPLNLYSPERQDVPFSQSSKLITFAAAPFVLTPSVRHQGTRSAPWRPLRGSLRAGAWPFAWQRCSTTRTTASTSRTRKGGWLGWKPSSSSNSSIRVVRAYPLIEIRQAVPCRAIRGNSNYLRRQYLSQQSPKDAPKDEYPNARREMERAGAEEAVITDALRMIGWVSCSKNGDSQERERERASDICNQQTYKPDYYHYYYY